MVGTVSGLAVSWLTLAVWGEELQFFAVWGEEKDPYPRHPKNEMVFCVLLVLGGWGCLLVGALTFQVKSFKLGFPLRRCGQDWFQEGQGPTD